MPGMRMRTMLTAVLAAWLGLGACAQAQELDAAPPGITCKAFLVYDLEHNRVIASQNADQERQIASLTKLMTALLACERLRFDGRYQLTEAEQEAFHTDTLRTEQMLELMLVASNNRTAEVVARILGGSEAGFTKLMNQRAQELGLAHTRFANATGLPGAGQHSTAEDVLGMMLALRRHDAARLALGRHSASVGGRKYTATLGEMYQRHPGLAGGKTGYTRAAGRCLALEYECDGRAYLLITLGSAGINQSYADAELLLSYYGLYSGALHSW
jgi:serine-type D-Ala-D-Ala carboxypeptidase (penicillin-binding protein 5/6)